MKRPKWLQLALPAAAMLTALVVSPYAGADSDLTGKRAPNFTVRDLTGKTWQLSALKGHPVVVDFWAFW